MKKKIERLIHQANTQLALVKSNLKSLEEDDIACFSHTAVNGAIKNLLELKITLSKIQVLEELQRGILETEED